MSLLSILETLLLGPLKLIFEVVFSLSSQITGHAGLAIIGLSLVMNILVLPLYRRADAMQEAARDTEERLREGVTHIKKTFSGDERMMMLQTYYRQNRYKPTHALRGSVSLLLEVPFFMAAYRFLSELGALNGTSLGPISDLGAPDGMLVVGTVAVNLLPVLMTLVNVVTSVLYLKDFPLKTKLQQYGLTLFFLIFLYNSPSGLVFYWTLNNLFSLVKTLCYRIPHRKPREKACSKRKLRQPCPWRFFLGALAMTVLVGLLIPSAYIGASPQEFLDMNHFYHPFWFVVSTLCLSTGMFLVWMGVFYWLSSPRCRVIFEDAVLLLCVCMLISYLFFGTKLGVISSALQYENGMFFSWKEQLLNGAVLVAAAVPVLLLSRKAGRSVGILLLTAVIAMGGMSAVNMVTVGRSVNRAVAAHKTEEAEAPQFQLSTTGKNVVVIMLDRALGEYVPYLLKEKPHLKEQFDGFTYYRNTVSFGYCTNFCIPSVLGGYEYTPVELNKRNTESLAAKHNEALKVMPVSFLEEGFRVTVCDPPYANYQWIPDLSIYDDYPDIHTYITKGAFGSLDRWEGTVVRNNRNFFCFSLMKTMPLVLQPWLYDGGKYHRAATAAMPLEPQVYYSLSTAEGYYAEYADSYNVLHSLPEITKITPEATDTFLMMANDATHDMVMLQTPDYQISEVVDNREYDARHSDRFTVDGRELKVENPSQIVHYHANMGAMLRLGEWLDYLRQQGVYDNTRIILVSDHGWNVAQLEELIFTDDEGGYYDVERFYPLLMVKDFGSTGFTVSDAFMTNADVPTLAMKDVLREPVNPFTGKLITDAEKYAHDQYLIASNEWDIMKNNGNTFLPAYWTSVKGDLWDRGNWSFLNEPVVLDEHSFP